MYINKVILYGNLTRDSEMRALPSGQSVANFAIATNRVYKDKVGEKKEQTEFHNIVAFGRQAEIIVEYFKKGDGIYIEGRLQTRSWDKDGEKQYRTEIVMEQFQFGSQARKQTATKPVETKEEIQYPDEEINPEDIPF